MWSHGAISDETLMLEKTVCNGSTYLREFVNNQESKGCNDVFNRVNEEFGDIDSGDLLLPSCLTSTSAQQFKLFGKHGKIPNMVCKCTWELMVMIMRFKCAFINK